MKNVCIQKPETFTCRDLSAGNIARKKLQFSQYHSKADQLICSGQPILFYFFRVLRPAPAMLWPLAGALAGTLAPS